MYVWRDAVLCAAVPAAHLGPVFDLAVQASEPAPAPSGLPAGGGDSGRAAVLATCGRDGFVRFWEIARGGPEPADWTHVTGVGPGIRMEEATEGLVCRPADAGPVSVRAVALRAGWRAGMWHVLAGTAGDEVWLLTLPHLHTAPTRLNSQPSSDGQRREHLGVADGGGGRLPAVECIVQAHPPAAAGGEAGLWGAVATHPQREEEFATCGGDGVLRVWDALACRPVVCATLFHALAAPAVDADADASLESGPGGAGGAGGQGDAGAWGLVAAEYSGDWGEQGHLAVAMVPKAQPGPGKGADGSRVVVVRVSDLQPGEPAPLVCVLARREGLGGRRVTCLRYSQGPDGPGDDGEGGGSERLLAVGTWDGCVLVFASYSCRP